ncbi:MAG: type VII secretion integral membrane protein EccD, partial [Corynebacterium sp.]|nr:type VII secretion integral membrane protein EccD [Corynebacterium sp.]
MAIDNVLRVSVRIDLTVGNKPFAMADLSLPAWSSLAEILEEVLDLTGAPTISRPWVARTATGIPIDPGIPLSHTQLEQGGVLVLSPERDLPAPVIRDAAEALVELSSSTRTIGLVDLLTLTGLAAVAVLLAGPVAGGVDPGIRMLILAVICVIILAWLPRSTAPEAATPVTRVVLPVFITLLAATAAL